MDEKELDRVLGAALRTDDQFLSWMFAKSNLPEQGWRRVLIRDDWPWGAPKGDQKKFRETDVLVVCEDIHGNRLALHIENKGIQRPFDPDQASDYPRRARAWVGVEKWGNYSQWKCVLIAPRDYTKRYPVDCSHFDVHVSYEEVAEQLPLFKV